MDEKSESLKSVEFVPPKDFKPPENSQPDKDWDMVCSFRTKSDGKICMTKLGDVDMPGYGSKKDESEAKETEHKPDYGQYSEGIMSSMAEGGMSGSQSQNY